MTDNEQLEPGLYIISLPIGNAKDITIRALEHLKKVDEIYCEDTRVTRKLLSIYEIKKKLNIYHDHNGEYVRPKIIKKIKGGKCIGIVSDAGTPLISDPGYKLVLSAKKEGLHVTSCPGVSAPITALTLSGLPTDSFYYLGFLPLKKKIRDKSLKEVKNLKTSLLIFETSRKINKTLNDLLSILGNREISICREMTKKFEEVITGRIEDILPILEKRALKGEIVIVVGAQKEQENDTNINEIIDNYKGKYPPSELAKIISNKTGLSKRVIYNKIIKK
ncbi:MAG: 16S rRNA (cytidine(1402)-2'-O)-methyltransferase [Pseudomonadota bacterium]|nr:16S rRNA (cytidine(1402)-2'-O)-methyltransferase [Pseudomonadota bacterium]MEC7830355.1 16S rRNA (cytidine(1402)-2'-O)-methyltransferase [Pseudomonadota bacterium]MEC9481239.1 16S rRNA (cytidine(1402)-2'-O)-methyltransferase [Pseudomonadota bacterium]